MTERRNATKSLTLESANRHAEGGGVDIVQLQTDRGVIECRLHTGEPTDTAIIWVGGAGGGLSGPARGLYPRLAGQLAPDGIGSLRLDYRRPNHLADCALDILAGIEYMKSLGYQRMILIGRSFGGAVVITAGAQSPDVVGVVALSSQNAGTELTPQVSPRLLLLMHGQADQVLSDYCSQDIYSRAREPKKLILLPGCGHGLDECQAEVDRDLLAWIREAAKK